jgi:hypothetical protein
MGRIVHAPGRVFRGIARGLRARGKVLAAVAAGVFVLNLFLPVLVLSLARKPFDHFTFNPWLKRLPEWLASPGVPWGAKLSFLSELALAWFIAENPIEGVEWGFIIDVPSLGRFLLISLLFGAYFALWSSRRGQLRACGVGARAAQQGGAAGALGSVLGFTTAPCSVMGCGVPVLPVVGLAFTGVSSVTLAFFADLSRIAIWVIVGAVTLGVLWLGWLVGGDEQGGAP